jgi:hypothetical protein
MARSRTLVLSLNVARFILMVLSTRLAVDHVRVPVEYTAAAAQSYPAVHLPAMPEEYLRRPSPRHGMDMPEGRSTLYALRRFAFFPILRSVRFAPRVAA